MAGVIVRPNLSCEVDGPDYTYCGVVTGLNVGTSATTDIFTIYGAAGYILRIVQILVSATIATAAAHFDCLVLTRRGAGSQPTSGTSSAVTAAIQDSQDQASQATNLKSWTAAPTVGGATVQTQANGKLFAPITNNQLNTGLQFNFGFGAGAKALLLRGVNEGCCVNLNGVTPANASSFDITVIWTERLAPLNNY